MKPFLAEEWSKPGFLHLTINAKSKVDETDIVSGLFNLGP
jgi:hypothetical protein